MGNITETATGTPGYSSVRPNSMAPPFTRASLNEFFADIQHTMKELNIGIFRVELANAERGSFVVVVDELG